MLVVKNIHSILPEKYSYPEKGCFLEKESGSWVIAQKIKAPCNLKLPEAKPFI